MRRGARREVGEQRLQLAGRRVQVLEHRRVRIRGRAELRHGRLQLLEQSREPVQAGLQVGRLGRGVGGGVVGLDDEVLDLRGVVGQRGDHGVGVGGQVLERLRVVAQQVEQVVGLVDRRHRAAQRGLDVLRARRHRRAQLVDDDREPLALGQPHDVGEHVGRNRRERVRRRQRGAGLQRLSVLPRLAVHEVLADQRLGPGLARRVRAECAEALGGHLHGHHRVEVLLVQGDRADLPGRDARHLERGVVDQAERVVELELVRRVARPAREPACDEHERDDHEQDGGADEDPTHRSVPGRDLVGVTRVTRLGVVHPAALHRAGAPDPPGPRSRGPGWACWSRPGACRCRRTRAPCAAPDPGTTAGRFRAPFEIEPTPITGATRLKLPFSVGATRVAEPLEPAGQVDGIRARGGELGGRLVERGGRLRERAEPLLSVGLERRVAVARVAGIAAGGARERHAQLEQLEQVVLARGARRARLRAPRADQVGQVAHGRHGVVRQRPQLNQELLELGRHRLGRVDQRRQRVERVAQVHERRVGQRHEPRQPLDRLAQRGLLGGQRLRGRAQVLDQRRQVGLLDRNVREQLARLDHEAREVAPVVTVELGEQRAARRHRRVQVLPRRLGRRALVRELGRRALDQVLEALERRRVQRVEQLVDVDRAGRSRGRNDPARGDLGRVARTQPQVDVAVGDPRQRGQPHRRLGPLVQRRVVRVADVEGQLRLPAARQRDVRHRPDGVAGDLDLVALDDLAASWKTARTS